MATRRAAFNMTTEGGGAAGLDRRYHLQLGETDMAGMLGAELCAVAVENVGDLQTRARHWSVAGGATFHQQLELLERAGDSPDGLGGDAGIERGGVELGMAEQHLDDADIDILLEQVRGKTVSQCMRRHPLVDTRHLCCLMDRAVDLAR